MDFKTAPEIQEAIRERAAHGVFGYSVVPDEWYQAYVGWWKRRHSFSIEKDCREMQGCATEFTQYLREHTGLYLSEGRQYGESGSSFIRMNIACSRSRLEDGLRRLAKGSSAYEEWTIFVINS